MHFGGYELRTPSLDKCLKSLAAEVPSKSIMVNGPRHCANLNHNKFSLFTDQCEGWSSDAIT